MADAESTARAATLTAQLDELDAHITSLLGEDDPSQHFQPDLFDRISYQLGPVAYPDLTERFLPRLGLVLKKTAEAEAASSSSSGWRGYPQPLIALTIKLLRPLSFTDALALCTPPYLITALGSPDEHLNALALAILDKATAAPSAASILAAVPGLLEALLARWLLSPSVSVGERGVRLLGDLLDVDCPRPQPAFTDEQRACLDIRLVARAVDRGHGAVWRRLFGPDEGLCWATLQRLEAELADADDPRVRAQRSLAQDRLLRLLPRLAVLDIRPLLVSELSTRAAYSSSALCFPLNYPPPPRKKRTNSTDLSQPPPPLPSRPPKRPCPQPTPPPPSWTSPPSTWSTAAATTSSASPGPTTS